MWLLPGTCTFSFMLSVLILPAFQFSLTLLALTFSLPIQPKPSQSLRLISSSNFSIKPSLINLISRNDKDHQNLKLPGFKACVALKLLQVGEVLRFQSISDFQVLQFFQRIKYCIPNPPSLILNSKHLSAIIYNVLEILQSYTSANYLFRLKVYCLNQFRK